MQRRQALVVNGRFLTARPTGLHRTARSLLDAAIELGLRTEIVAPAGTDDRRVSRTLWAPPGRLGGQIFEQVRLPLAAGHRRVLSLTNTGPVAARSGVVMVHDLAPLVGPQWFRQSMSVYLRLVLTAARRAELVLTVSQQVAGELVAAGVRAPVRVVRPAVDPGFTPAEPVAVEEVRRRLRLHDDYLLFVGWADPRKDLATAVAAHRLARRRRPHRLVLVGTPHPVFAPVEVPGDVLHAGYVDDVELAALLTGAAALVYPSRYEGFGLPPLEAWACGTPAIVADTPVLRESTSGAATYVSPGDVDGWATAMRTALDGDLDVPDLPTWTWRDAGAQLLQALAASG